MQPVKIFLASSGELRAERDGIFKIVAQINKLHPHLHLEIVEWEIDLPSGNYDGKRIQDEINPLLCECQLTYVLFYSKAGEFTIEELNLAQSICPKVFVYFKSGFSTTDRAKNKAYDTVLEIRERLEKANQVLFKEYGDLTGFELHFKDDLHNHLFHKFPKPASDGVTQSHAATTPLAPRTDLYHLPDLQPHFTGRAAELQLLDGAWANENTHLVQFVAPGGTGKTQLITYWLRNRLPESKAAKPAAIYAWSFYSQGSDEGRQASSDLFFDRCARFFGMETLPTDPKERGRSLAARLRAERCLLILDGIEPLQYPPTTQAGLAGKLKDPALAALLRELSFGQPGLCILTTRIAVTELAGIGEPQHLCRHLENFDATEGAAFLQNLGVKGKPTDLEAAAVEYHGHALALRLLGNYLVDLLDADVRKRDRIPHLLDDERSGSHARRVMEAYVRWFRDSSDGVTQSHAVTKPNPPELVLLNLMGLFDRPAPVEALDALCAEPDISGLTERLRQLDPQRVQRAFQHLKKLGLLEENRLRFGQPPRHLTHLPALRELESLDAHPLVREHFGQKMATEQPEAWQEANARLYRFYKALPKKQQPNTLEEMEPLYLAMAFGCRAGLQQEVLDEIYWKRIRRKDEVYTFKKLGAFGSDLAALVHLFERVWDQPFKNMTEAWQGWLLNEAGFGLRGLGRLREAAEPMRTGMEMAKIQNDWKNVAQGATNLSELYLSLGAVSEALSFGLQAVEFADQSEESMKKIITRATLANVLHQSGVPKEAQRLFAEAEAIQWEKRQPKIRFLYSVWGFQYCELLLGLGKWEEVLDRAQEGLKISTRLNDLSSIALDQLSIARAHDQAAETESTATHVEAAAHYHDMAMEGLRKASDMEFIAKGLLARAHWYLQTNRTDLAAQDLAEVLEIAEDGSMGLYLVDYHLGMAHLRRLEGQHEEAERHKAEALRRIEETGYERRRKEAEEI